jgi:hypothetical protein
MNNTIIDNFIVHSLWLIAGFPNEELKLPKAFILLNSDN